ncbi:MAG: hypothetical protein WCT44_02715 [Candidatus Paceibacterota bacterium]
MKSYKYVKMMFWLGLAGVLFSGYLSSVKFFTSTCALNEPCPYFLGYPACYFGFGMFLIIFVSALLGLMKKISEKGTAQILTTISALGILFAGYFTIPEIQKLLSNTETGYSLGLPTCAYGLVFYLLIFILSLSYLRKGEQSINGSR